MTSFQAGVTSRLKTIGQSYGLEFEFQEKGVHAVSRFEWKDEETLLLVSDGELIFEFDGEHYFETPEDPNSTEVLQFCEFVRLCLEGLPPKEALASAKQSASHAR